MADQDFALKRRKLRSEGVKFIEVKDLKGLLTLLKEVASIFPRHVKKNFFFFFIELRLLNKLLKQFFEQHSQEQKKTY